MTQSETLFEEYLHAQGWDAFEHEPKIEGCDKRPDYRVTVDGVAVYFEIKEFEALPEHLRPGFGAYDPYGPIREKINDARPQLHPLKGQPCAIVLFNTERPLVSLEPTFVFGAMLGDAAIRIPFDREAGMLNEAAAEEGFFGGGGRMIRYRKAAVPGGNPEAIAAQNTTIGAIVVLEHVALGERKARIFLERLEREVGHRLTSEQTWDALEHAVPQAGINSKERVLRTVVLENPYGVAAIPTAFGRGRFDERYGAEDDRITRLYVGDDLRQLEASEAELGLRR